MGVVVGYRVSVWCELDVGKVVYDDGVVDDGV